MYLLNNQKINIDAPITIDGITYPNLRDSSLRAQLGVQELPDPVYPDARYYYWSENTNGSLEITPKSVEQVKQQKLQEIATKRYEKETGGITLGESKITTDRQTQATITSALLRLQRKPEELIDWKGEAGWTQLNKAAVEVIADAVGDHVQACFTAEKNAVQALEALSTFDEVIGFEIVV
jgi:hypothetical protein